MAAGGGDGAHPAREKVATKVPFKDPKKKKKKKKDEMEEEDPSDEDLALRQQLEVYVERVQDADLGVQKLAVESIRLLLFFFFVKFCGFELILLLQVRVRYFFMLCKRWFTWKKMVCWCLICYC